MKNSILKIKSSFRKGFKEEIIEAEVSLENGKTYKVQFDPNKGHVVIQSTEENNQINLNIEERTAIIEAILDKCATFVNSILKASISLYIEGYRLVDDTTGKYIISNENLCQEFVKSPFAYDTSNKALKTLLNMYMQVDLNKERIGKEDFYVIIPDTTIVSKMDAKHFFPYCLVEYKEIVNIDYNNGKEIIVKPIITE